MTLTCIIANSNGDQYCPMWYRFVLPSLTIYIGGLVILVFFRILGWINDKLQLISGPKRHFLVASRLHELAFGSTLPARCLLFAVFILSLASFAFYLLDVSVADAEKRPNVFVNATLLKQSWTPELVQLMDAILNVGFTFHFVLRAAAASDKLEFWLSWQTIVDMATLPACVMFLYFKKFWSGLRFLRAWYIFSLPDILQIGGMLNDPRAIRLVRILFAFLTLWLVAAGFIHMFENNGDPWLPDFNGQHLSYFECIYFLVITSSTIGYGDISCKTTLGRLFDIAFVFVGLGMFANILPELSTLAELTSSYVGRLRLPVGRRHVIVLGHVTAESATKFVEAFLHPDRESKNMSVVFLHRDFPSVSMEGLLKRYKNAVYFVGNEMDATDLQRVELANADACIILADELTHDPDEEDSANIMRAIAIKNANGQARVLIQLIRDRNKTHLLNIPSWNDMDSVVCLEEFKMGAMAQNCWAPGFATLLSLLLTAFSVETKSDGHDHDDLSDLDVVYAKGVGYEIYDSSLSPDFVGKSFTDVAEVCYKRLRLVLLAIKTSKAQCDESGAFKKVSLNPGRQYIVRQGDLGFFLAHSAEDVLRATHFCSKCHSEGGPLPAVLRCMCESKREKLVLDNDLLQVVHEKVEKTKKDSRIFMLLHNIKHARTESEEEANDGNDGVVSDEQIKSESTDLVPYGEDLKDKFDFTGMFYWRPKRPISDVVVRSLREATEKNFHDHVIVCVFAESNSPQIGLRNFVMPLRSSNREYSELKPIVIVGNLQYIEREWEHFDTFPNLYVMPGSAMDRTVMRSINVNLCSMCVVLSAKAAADNQAMLDKYSILSYLNIKSMRFGGECDEESCEGSTTQLATRAAIGLSSTRTPKALRRVNGTRKHNSSRKVNHTSSRIVNNVPVIIQITIPENILVLDDDFTHTTSTPLVKLSPFACGSTFAGDVLNSAISVAFYNPDALTLIRELVTGGSTTESDKIFAEGLGFCEGTDKDTIKANRNRARIHQFSLTDPLYSGVVAEGSTYAELFVNVLKQFGYVCLGLYRLRGDSSSEQRIVLVSPPDKFHLIPSDKVICLQPFEAPLPNPALSDSVQN